MAQLSAGVQVNEIDLSIIVPQVSTSVAAFAGVFTKGPVDDYTLITSVEAFEMTYGKPTISNYNDWYQVYNFLQYSNSIYVNRAMDDVAMLNSAGEIKSTGDVFVDAAANNLVKNQDDFELNESTYAFDDAVNNKYRFIARSAGAEGDKTRVIVANEAAMAAGTTEIYTGAGITIDSLFTENIDQTNGEIVVVVEYDGKIVERWVVSVDPAAVSPDNGKSIYIETVINRQSQYVYVKDNTATTYPYDSVSALITDGLLTGGADGTPDVQAAYDVFDNKESIEIDLVIANEEAHAQAATLCGNRKDCIGFLGAKYDDVVGIAPATAVENCVTYVTQTLNLGDAVGKYNAFFGNYKYQYSTILDKYIWVNVAGDAAGLRADTNTNRATWWASAGIERGALKNTVKLAFNPNQGQRDNLYKNMVNPLVSFVGQGNLVWGQKTMQSRPSAFDRINVRGLFNELERAIEKMAKYYVFELNDAFTRTRFKATVEPFLRYVKANRGVYDFYVRCDETNNPPYVIDSNQFVADIAIKPTRTAEFLTLNFIAVGTGVDFKEIFTK